MQATLTPDFVNQPKTSNGKYGSIKVGNVYYSVPVGMLPSFQKGVPASVEYEAVNQNGKTFYNITGYAPQPAPPPQFSPAPSGTPAYTPPVQVAQAAPRVEPKPNGHGTPSETGHKDRVMFIMGVTGRAMGSGNFPPTEIKMLALAADEAWTELEQKWTR